MLVLEFQSAEGLRQAGVAQWIERHPVDCGVLV